MGTENYSCPYCVRRASRAQDLKAHFTREHASDVECEGRYPDDLLSEFPDYEEREPPIDVSLRNQAIERDGGVCQRCLENDSGLIVHHLIPRSAGGPDHVDNLITLCRKCHTEAHRDLTQIHKTHLELLDELRDTVCTDAEHGAHGSGERSASQGGRDTTSNDER